MPLRDPVAARESCRKWRANNRERSCELRRASYKRTMARAPEMLREKARLWRINHKARAREFKLLRYGVSLADYQRRLDGQGGVCAVCHSSQPGHKHGVFFVDHDHSTGQVRGLLCSSCNVGIGCLRDDPDLLRSAAAYLDEAYRASKKAVA